MDGRKELIILYNWTVSDWTAETFSSLFCFCFCFLIILGKLDLSRVDSQKFLVTKMFFFFFFSWESAKSGRSKISRHYFVFCFCFCFLIILGNLTFPEWTVKNFSSLFCFCFFILCIILYLARDSCKK